MTMTTSVRHPATRLFAIISVLCLGLVVIVDAAIKVRAEPDPDYDFATVRTWAWDAEAGDVIMARTANDDPAPLKARVDPLVRQYVEAAMAKKGLTLNAGKPDVQLHYYVLVTINTSGHQMGQFLPAVPYWGLPPFAPATTSLNIVTKGSLILDAMLPGSVGDRRVVWRGVAQSTVSDGDSQAVREARLREASTELVKRFPLKKKGK
jgi:Domain of unknown function (DUF4136)